MPRGIDHSLEKAGLPPLERSAWIEVDLDQLIANTSALSSLAHPSVIGAVVKADGYGHGLEMAARCAVAGGAQWLCVADAAEAVRLRQDGYGGRVFVLYPVPAAMVQRMARSHIDVTVGSHFEAQTIAERLRHDDPALAIHLEIDTGMTRGGVAPEDAVATAAEIFDGPSVSLAGVWTHLAAPEDSAATDRQLKQFDSVLDQLTEAGIDTGFVHAAASGGLLASDTSGHGMVRPGLALYGLHPDAGDPLPPSVAPALALKAHPVRVAKVPRGTPVGYAGTWIAQEPSTIATLPIGYADGWSRVSSPGSSVLVEGERAPLVGRVSSDSLTVDVTGITGIGVDSEFVLLGNSGTATITVDEIAVVRGTISWEVLQQLGGRLTRVYLSGETPVALRPESSIDVAKGHKPGIPVY